MPEIPATTERGWTQDENGLWYPLPDTRTPSWRRRTLRSESVSKMVATVAFAVLLAAGTWLLLAPTDPCDDARADGLTGVSAC